MHHQVVEPLVVLVVAVVVMAHPLEIMINQLVHLLLLQLLNHITIHLLDMEMPVVLVVKMVVAVVVLFLVELVQLDAMALPVMVLLVFQLATLHIHLSNQQFLAHFNQEWHLK